MTLHAQYLLYAKNIVTQGTGAGNHYQCFLHRLLGCRSDLIGAASTVNSSLMGLILEITMKPGEIDLCFKALHL